MLIQVRCAVCGAPGRAVCERCGRALPAAPTLAAPRHLDGCSALFDYSAARPMVTAFKNGGRRDLAGWLAGRMAGGPAPPSGAVVTWAPTGGARRRARGFDHAELLARALARRWRLPCQPLLRRLPGPAQAGRSALVRRHHPGFVALRACPQVVVVVDDVVTTGATLAAAAAALRAGGAARVLATVIARAPQPSSRCP